MNDSLPESAPLAGAIEYIRCTQPFIFRRRVLFGECDPAGVVYTPRFVDFGVIASQHFLGHLLGGGATESRRKHGFDSPCKALGFVFHASLQPDQIFDMTVSVVRVGTTTFELAIAGTAEDGTAVFDATVTIITVRADERVAIPVPMVLRDALVPHFRDPGNPDRMQTSASID